jgi:membrane associated rhomboid family serine protease
VSNPPAPPEPNGSRNADDFCYRHPDRQSFIICQRCGRTVCAECQTQAPVGVHCPECVREARQSAPRTKPASVTRMRTSLRRGSGAPVVTYGLIGTNVVLFLLEFVTGGFTGIVYQALAYWPPLTATEPWRMITSAFLHSPGSIFHILFNMYSLFIFGPMLEHQLGRARFLAMYLLAALGGSVAVLLLAPSSIVVGASGAIFGLLGAYFVIQRRLGGNATQLVIVIALNLAIGFVVPGIAWQAHLGGLVVGAGIAAIYVATRRREQKAVQIAGVVAVAAALVITTVVTVLA